MTRVLLSIGLAGGLALAASTALARVSEEEAARLGGALTPVGAERAGNAAGTIPAWTGGLTEPPSGWKPTDPRVDPFANDAMLFSIDRSNVAQYKDRLSPGQVALIEQLDGYRMEVYPTRRSCAYPDWSTEPRARTPPPPSSTRSRSSSPRAGTRSSSPFRRLAPKRYGTTSTPSWPRA